MINMKPIGMVVTYNNVSTNDHLDGSAKKVQRVLCFRHTGYETEYVCVVQPNATI